MNRKRTMALAAALGVVLAAAVLVLAGRGRVPTAVVASGTVEATEAALGFPLAGRVDSIAVREGMRVERGMVLAWLDRSELLARRAMAEAQVGAARARLAELERGFRTEEREQAHATLRAATRRWEEAEAEYQRAQRLFAGGAISRRELDAAETALAVAAAERDRAVKQASLMDEGPRREQIDAQRAVLRQAEAQRDQLDVLLDQALVRAPFGGVVTARHREPGEAVAPGVPVLTIVNLDDRWIRIYVPGDAVGRLRLGQRAEITADAYPDRIYPGEIVFIADEAEFTPRTVQTADERVKLVYRVKVRVVEDPAHDLKPGLPADVRIPAGAP